MLGTFGFCIQSPLLGSGSDTLLLENGEQNSRKSNNRSIAIQGDLNVYECILKQTHFPKPATDLASTFSLLTMEIPPRNSQHKILLTRHRESHGTQILNLLWRIAALVDDHHERLTHIDFEQVCNG